MPCYDSQQEVARVQNREYLDGLTNVACVLSKTVVDNNLFHTLPREVQVWISNHSIKDRLRGAPWNTEIPMV